MAAETIDTILDSKIARAILSEVASGDWLDKEIPEDETELIKLAQYYVVEARLAIEDGMDNEHLRAIINLSQVSPPVLSAPAGSLDSVGGPPEEIDSFRDGPIILTEEEADKFHKIMETHPRRSSGGYSESDLRDYDGLPIPSAIPEDVLEMPTDLTDLGDKAVRRLYSAFGSYLGRARWKLAISISNQANATHLRDESYRVSFLKTYKKSKVEGEKLSQAVLEQLAQDTDDYKAWSDKVRKHTDEVISWKALVEIYGGNVDRLSREWTMRTEQYERER